MTDTPSADTTATLPTLPALPEVFAAALPQVRQDPPPALRPRPRISSKSPRWRRNSTCATATPSSFSAARPRSS